MSSQIIRKTKICMGLALALGMGIATTASGELMRVGVHLDNNDRLGDAGIFQYYTANGGWQTFIRVINTSDDAVSVKVRFREAANSREVLDYIIFLSPYDMWAGWTDANATGSGMPGVRTSDTSCLYPLPDTNNTGEGWKTLNGNLLGADFQDRGFTDIYNDNGDNYHTSLERMSEGHLEIIGIAAHDATSPFGLAVTHNHTTGKPANCSQAGDLFEAEAQGGEGFDLGNVLAMNGYVINVAEGMGGGFDPDILADFASRSLVSDANETATDPDMDSGFSPFGPWEERYKQKGDLKGGGPNGSVAVTGSVDLVSYELQRASVINEWAASANPGNLVSDYYTQWILTFPTKHYYVDLQNDGDLLDDVSPTLVDPNYSYNDAYAPFNEEFDEGYNSDGYWGGKSCEPYRMRIWNREEEKSQWTSPAPIYPVELCNEVNVLVFNDYYEGTGLRSAFSVTIPWQLLPVDAGGATSERGWASMDFYDEDGTGISPYIEKHRLLGPGDIPVARAGLPVTGWLFSVFNTNSSLTNHTAINSHKYKVEEMELDTGGQGS
jgi:hypothetical protein